MKVICIRKDEYSPIDLIIGKEYNVIKFDRDKMNPYYLVDDGDDHYLIPEENFIPLQEFREKQLKNLGL